MLQTMHSYAALLGNNPSLSIAELAAILPDFTKDHLFPGNIVTFKTATVLDQAFLNRLGGTILIATNITGDFTIGLEDLPTLLAVELKTVKGKVTFSLRCSGISPHRIREFYKNCKQGLKKKGIPCRYVGSEREPAKPIQLHDEGMLDPKKGCELVILHDKERIWIGRTVAAQNVKTYTLRDIEKPVRDTKVGLLPPKLAQILLNFGQSLIGPKKHPTVFDPFCGTGVIPMEAMISGWHVLASDNADKAVSGTEKNIEWVRKVFKIFKKDIESTVWKQDATKPFVLKEKPDVIVTEGTLGPALKSRATVKDAEAYCKKAEELTAAFLNNCAKTLPGVPVVMTLPVWYAQKKMIHLTKVWQVAEELGFRPSLPPHADPSHPERFSLMYRRNDQFVGREIILLKPKKQ